MENFEEQFQIFRNAGAVWETNAQRLADDLRQLANDRKKPAEIGQRARSVVEENRGAARRIHDAIIASSARVERVAISP
jgi:3-deoxy-D-manno-octulosonic-acid transferase